MSRSAKHFQFIEYQSGALHCARHLRCAISFKSNKFNEADSIISSIHEEIGSEDLPDPSKFTQMENVRFGFSDDLELKQVALRQCYYFFCCLRHPQKGKFLLA